MEVVKNNKTAIHPYPILIDGHPILRQKCDPIEANSKDLQTIIKRMFVTLNSTSTGLGIAAPQVGLPVNLFVLGGQMLEKVFINPEIIKRKGSQKKDFEGCLSVPSVYARVERHDTIVIKWLDENWEEHTQKFSGFIARVIQHECDHLEGIEFYDRITPHEMTKIKLSIDKIQRGELPNLEYLFKLKDDESK